MANAAVQWQKSAAPAGRRRAARQNSGRRHHRDLLLLHRERQLGCTNEYGWGAQTEPQPLLVEPEPLLIEPPPGLEYACAASHPSAEAPAPTAVTLDTMLPPHGRENSLPDMLSADTLSSNNAPDDKRSMIQGLKICSEFADDSSTVGSDGIDSPVLVARQNSLASSLTNDSHSGRTTPSSTDADFLNNGSPRLPAVPSLEEALGFAPTPARSAAKKSTKISLEDMLGFAPPAHPPAADLENAMQEKPQPNPLALYGMLPTNTLACPWWGASYTNTLSPFNSNEKIVNLEAGGAAGRPGASTMLAAAWDHAMHTNSMLGATRASSGTTRSSEIFQI